MSNRISAVLFDYGLVLSGPPNPAAWQRMHRALALDPDTFHGRYWEHRHDYDRGTLTGEAYWQGIANNGSNRVLSTETLETVLSADVDLWTDINQPMLDWAQRLQRRGIRTGILSNLGDRIQAGIVQKLAWLDAFHHHTWSHALGVIKPDSAIYRHAAEGLDTAPAEVLFIDDRPENIAAARDTGMHAVQYTDWPGFLAAMHSSGYAHLLAPETRDPGPSCSADQP